MSTAFRNHKYYSGNKHGVKIFLLVETRGGGEGAGINQLPDLSLNSEHLVLLGFLFCLVFSRKRWRSPSEPRGTVTRFLRIFRLTSRCEIHVLSMRTESLIVH